MKKTKDPNTMLSRRYSHRKARQTPAAMQTSLVVAVLCTEASHNGTQAASLLIVYNDVGIKKQDIAI